MTRQTGDPAGLHKLRGGSWSAFVDDLAETACGLVTTPSGAKDGRGWAFRWERVGCDACLEHRPARFSREVRLGKRRRLGEPATDLEGD